MTMLRSTAFLFLASLAAPGIAQAAGDDITRIFSGKSGLEAASACFSRHYTREHLASHPDQNVVSMTGFVSRQGDEEDYYSVSLRIRFRGVDKDFDVSGGCSQSDDGKKALGCGVECDGGHLDVRVKSKDAILIDIPDQVRLYDPDESESRPEGARFGTDDKVFRLDRAALKDCLDLVYDDEKKAAIAASSP